MKIFLFFSHKLTSSQIEDIKKMGIKEIVYLPSNLQEKFSNIPPEVDNLSEYVRVFAEYLLKHSKPNDYILIQGDFGLVYHLVNISKSIGLIPIYSTTKRVVIEEKKGKEVIKTSKFEHIRFRRF